jgi:CMP-N,N'-diacetyllegionaminic acid synthase
MGKTVVIIPAKGHSRRVTGKNMRRLGGKRPLVDYTILAALKCPAVDEVYVSTDSEEIQRHAISLGAQVPFLRPSEQSGDNVHSSVPIIHLLTHLLNSENYTTCVNMLPTHPFRHIRTISEMIELSRNTNRNVVSLERLGATTKHLKVLNNNSVTSLIDSEDINFQTGASPEIYALRAAVQCAPVKALLEHKSFHSPAPLGHVLDRMEAIDIDTEEDLEFAGLLLPLFYGEETDA